MYWTRSPGKPAVRHTRRAHPTDGLWGPMGGRTGCTERPETGRHSDTEPSDRSRRDGLQGLDESIHGLEGGVQVGGHAYAAATDAHVNAALGERPREIRPQAALRAQPASLGRGGPLAGPRCTPA
jgi:hypothetical protein